jgi:hypothetical protein
MAVPPRCAQRAAAAVRGCAPERYYRSMDQGQGSSAHRWLPRSRLSVASTCQPASENPGSALGRPGARRCLVQGVAADRDRVDHNWRLTQCAIEAFVHRSWSHFGIRRYGAGSTGSPAMIISKYTCVPTVAPVLPTTPTFSPAATVLLPWANDGAAMPRWLYKLMNRPYGAWSSSQNFRIA